MSVLLLTLAGSLQAWGDSSRFERRDTRHEPTKSGVLGLIAAAQGRPRDADLSDLGVLGFGVRIDQEGVLLRDFQTARHPKWKDPKLSYRYYLQDALFVAGLEGEKELLEGIAESVRSPQFPLYLGRRSCPPSRPLVLGINEGSLDEALATTPWQAAEWYRARHSGAPRLRVVRDARFGDAATHGTIRDVPVSFSPEHREYGWRDIVEAWVTPTSDSGEGPAAAPSAPQPDGGDLPSGQRGGTPQHDAPPARPSHPDGFDELI